MPMFRKKPVVIEAVQLTLASRDEVAAWCGGRVVEPGSDCVVISTLEGDMTAMPGDWVIKGVQGEFYPIKPDIFAETYEAVDQ